jgi:hypothetical protein
MGSVNAARSHFQMAVDALLCARLRWPACLAQLVTHRYAPAEFAVALTPQPSEEIKVVIDWSRLHNDGGV